MVTGQPGARVATSEARELDLAEVIRRLARADEAALEALYDETSGLVHGLALRILRDRSAAEEVTIEVYVQAHRQAGRYDPSRGTPSAWLLTLTRSRAIDRLRAEIRRRTREEPLEGAALAVSSTDDPMASSLAAERRRTVQKALAALSREQRQVIEIAYFSGLSHSEIAAKLGVPLGTVKTRIRTGMMVLRDALRPAGGCTLLMIGSPVDLLR